MHTVNNLLQQSEKMFNYTIKNIEKDTGLKYSFIRKCLNQMPDIFAPHYQKGGQDNTIALTHGGVLIFRRINELKGQGISLPFIHQKLIEEGLSKGSNQQFKAVQTDSADSQDGFKWLYTELENERQRLNRERQEHETEIQRRRDAEEALRSIQMEIKLLTGGQTIEDAQKNREARKLKRVQLIAILKNLRFWNTRKRKKLLAELEALDYETLGSSIIEKPAETPAENLTQNPISS